MPSKYLSVHYNADKLRVQQTQVEFKKVIEQKLQAADSCTGSIDQREYNISFCITETLDVLRGKWTLKKRPWLTEKIIELCDQRRKSTKED